MQSAAIADVTTWPNLTLMIPVLTVFIGIVKLIFDFHFEKNKFHHKNLEIAQTSLSSNLYKPSLKQRFLTEQVFSSIYRCSLSYDEINVLLRYSNPSRAFELFVKGNVYLKLSNNMKSIVLNGKYRRIKLGRFKIYPRNILHFIRYFFLGVIAMLLLIPAIDIFQNSTWFTVSSTFSIFDLEGIFIFILSAVAGAAVWVLAFKAIASIGKINYAFKFIEIDK